jgi:DNA mismatch repair ATPase MutS
VANDEIRELLKSVMDVREWLARLDTKLDTLTDVKETAESARETAEKALAKAEENERNLQRIAESNNRSWHVLVGMGATFIVSILIYLITK